MKRKAVKLKPTVIQFLSSNSNSTTNVDKCLAALKVSGYLRSADTEHCKH